MNLWDALLLLAVAGIVFFAVRSARRAKKRGGCAVCACGRSGGDCRNCVQRPQARQETQE